MIDYIEKITIRPGWPVDVNEKIQYVMKFRNYPIFIIFSMRTQSIYYPLKNESTFVSLQN